MKKTTTHQMVNLAFMASLALILFLFEFPLPGSPLQFDLSDVPVIISAYIFGFGPAIMVAFLKNLAHIFFITRNAGIAGEVANFLYAMAIMTPIALMRHKIKASLGKTFSLAIFTVLFAAVLMHVLNYLIVFPLYGLSRVGAWEQLFYVFLPFNLIKGSLLMVIFIAIKPYFDRMGK